MRDSLPGRLLAVVAILGGDADDSILLFTYQDLRPSTPNIIWI